jgi:methylenetetrahydrofolate--tRNA-(uracil-5-)-methyltransferase
MAERGRETLRHGPMKPFGLTDPHRPAAKPYAVVQLRQDNKLGTLFNMVGFQTKLKHGEQVRIFRTIPGLAKAEFARLGGLHRNTFLNSPKLLDDTLRLKACRGYALPDRSPAARATWNRRRSACSPAACRRGTA